MSEVRFRRWSDGLEMAVPTIEDFREYYGDGLYYIPSGEHATHTIEGFPLKTTPEPTTPTKRTRARRKGKNANVTSESVPTAPDGDGSGD